MSLSVWVSSLSVGMEGLFTHLDPGASRITLLQCERVFVLHFQVRGENPTVYHLHIFIERDSHEILFPEGFTVLTVFHRGGENTSERKTEQLLGTAKVLMHQATSPLHCGSEPSEVLA